MKRILVPAVIIMCLSALLLAGCANLGLVIGSGKIVDREYNFKDFNNVNVSDSFQIEITRADSYKVSVSTHENIIEHVDISQSGRTLEIRLKPGSYTNADTKAMVTMPEIARLSLSGSSRGNLKGFKSNNDFELLVSGASQMDMEMEAGKTTLNISGASRVTGQLQTLDAQLTVSGASHCELTGSAGKAVLDISGASQVLTQNMQLQNADVEVSGASRVNINAVSTLGVNVTGASTLEYLGNPTMSKVNVNGASRLIGK